MNNSKLSTTGSIWKVLGCIIFDLAIIIAYFSTFGLFLFISPLKSFLILIVLIIGLIAVNGVIILPTKLFSKMGVPYTTSTMTLLVLYTIISNILSIFLIPVSTTWYIVWQMIVLATFLVIFSFIMVFLKGVGEDIAKYKQEEEEHTQIMLQLLEIGDSLTSKENQEEFYPCIDLYKKMKERIQASTPFGRINGNHPIEEIENQIKNNLIKLKDTLHENSKDINISEIQKLIENTKKLVINRETLNIKK